MNEIRCIKNNNAIRFEIPKGTQDAEEYAKKKLKEMGFKSQGWKFNFKK